MLILVINLHVITLLIFLFTKSLVGSIYTQVLSINDTRYGYNAARDCYEDLMTAGVMDPSKVFINKTFCLT